MLDQYDISVPVLHVKGEYYSLTGERERRAFLASPLEFSRITSGFKMRLDPILHKDHRGG